MRSRELFTLFAVALVGAAAGCTTLLGDFSSGPADGGGDDATTSGDAAGTMDGTAGDASGVKDAAGDTMATADSSDSAVADAHLDATIDAPTDGMPPADASEEEAAPSLVGLGGACTASSECGSTFCAPEGICCNTQCSGSCEVCNVSGMCVAVPANQQPRTGHPGCTGGGAAPCGGYCDGVDIGCFYPTTQ